MAILKLASGLRRKVAEGYEVPVYSLSGATDVDIVADVLIANGALTIAAQPSAVTFLVFTVTDADSSITSLDAAIVGVGPDGAALSESLSLDNAGAGGTVTVPSVNRYMRVTSITLSGAAGNGAGDNVSVGTALAVSGIFGVVRLQSVAGGVYPAYNDWIERGPEDEVVLSITADAASTGGIDIEESDNGTDLNATLSTNLAADTPYSSKTKLTRRLWRFRFTNDAGAKQTNADILVRARRSRQD